MSETIIKRGITLQPHLLKDAEFSKAKAGSGIYCYVMTADGDKYALTRREAMRKSDRSERYTARFRAWLAEQDDPIWKNLNERD